MNPRPSAPAESTGTSSDSIPDSAVPPAGDTLRRVPRRRTEVCADDGTDAQIIAAGALCWRLHRGELEVLLIHRPRYDDWSFPKGKLDPGETIPECAVREVSEEIGLQVRLGVPLPVTRYDVRKNGRPKAKEVWYWAARIIKGTPTPDGQETDEVRWAPVAVAHEMLTNETDREPLEELERLHSRMRLHTSPFVVLRHAKAKPRASWSRAEGERPLAATGKRQARAVERLLTAWRPRLIETSPWRRCVETVAPYVRRHRHKLKHRKSLTEKRAQEDPRKPVHRTRKCLEVLQPTVLCTHRPVLPLVLDELRDWIHDPALLQAMPDADPYLSPGAVLVAQQAVDRGGEIVSVEIYEPFED
ncbi:NUDIX hydrolase [Nesterenkonia xinjiangensis]|uniref:8-oxo-dGTP diphosphatase n=1 Tax=Nesterenkonia xinjiangensis TaxID=225327 RepID=A0A7Z0GK54_9MICC|nr:NUDIX domain-containing protein [Nesterenkonia xinjiangensis]NYJ77442.1 8-oxo-dGTP diphosphatase [Nesterenkonia xinjiangensis]